MKKLLLILLALTMCVSMCACGNDGQTNNKNNTTVNKTNDVSNSNNKSSVSGKTSSENENLEIGELVGTWNTSLWFFDSTLKINSNTTYTYGLENGTVSITEQGFKLTDRSGMYNTSFGISGDYIYECGHDFDKDLEFGLAFSPDANGKTDQTFNYTILNVSTIDTSYSANSIELDLDSDGKFKITTGRRSYSSFTKKDEFKGTYSFDGSILSLKYNGKGYPLVVKDGVIYFHVFKK